MSLSRQGVLLWEIPETQEMPQAVQQRCREPWQISRRFGQRGGARLLEFVAVAITPQNADGPQPVEDRHDYVGGIGLEVPAQRLSGIGSPEAVGAERGEVPRHPPGDLIRDRLHEIGHRDDGP